MDLTLCFQAGYIEELAVRSSVDVDDIFRGSEGVRPYKGEKDSKQGGREGTVVFDFALDGENV